MKSESRRARILEPFGIAFSPDGSRLALGYSFRQVVDVLDGFTLARSPGPDCRGIKLGELSTVAWSHDGETLYAATNEGSEGHRSRPELALAKCLAS